VAGFFEEELSRGTQELEMDEAGQYRDWKRGGTEPPLQELMNDPIMHLLLQRDGLTSEVIWQFLEQARHHPGKIGGSLARQVSQPSSPDRCSGVP
jgi:hypothetical protein